MKQRKMRLSVRLLSLALAVSWLLCALPFGTTAAAALSPVMTAEVASSGYYGRAALSRLQNSTALLYAYDRIAAGVESSKTDIPVYNGTDRITAAEINTVFDAYRRDHSEHFWIGNDYSYSYDLGTGNVTDVMPSYIMSGSALEKAKTDLNAAVSEMVRGISGAMSEYDREKLLHDRLAEKVVYDGSGTYAHSAYGALVQGKAVCDGYAKAFQTVLRRAGIRSFLITGSSVNPSTGVPEGHAWNAVRIDGKYYHVDVTWDDQGENIFYAYFNKTTAAIREDHTIDTTAYALPVCSSEDADYFVVNGGRMPAFGSDAVAALLKAGGGTARLYCTGDRKAFAAALVAEANVRALAQALGYTGNVRCSYVTLGREFIYTLQGTGNTVGTLSGTVKSFGPTTDTVTVQLFKSGSSSAAYNTTVKGNSASYTISGVASGTYTMKVSKKNHVTREYTVTVTAGTKTQNAQIHLVGDVNLDGVVSIKDCSRLFKHVNKTQLLTDAYALKCANTNGDTVVDIKDCSRLFKHVNKTRPLW